jgi:hypothetical protein
MSMYKIQMINQKISELYDYMEIIEKKILIPYVSEIKKLPREEQKSEWQKYYQLQKLINILDDTINNIVEEIETMHTSEEFKHNQKTIIQLKHYIKNLGGDPGLISYTKNADLI